MKDIIKKYTLLLFLLLAVAHGVSAQTAADLKLSYTRDDVVVYDDFVICNDGVPPFKFQLKNETAEGIFDSFQIKINDAEPESMSRPGSLKTLTIGSVGVYRIQLIGESAAGKVTKDFSLKMVGKPLANLRSQDNEVKCLGAEIKYVAKLEKGGTSGTKYYLDYDDGTAADVKTNDELNNGEAVFVHKYMKSYCNMEDHERFFKVTLSYKNECYSGELTSVSEYVAVPFTASYTFDQLGSSKVCTYEKIYLRNITSGGSLSDCSRSNRIALWKFSNGETSEDWEPYIEYKNVGSGGHNIKLIVTNDYACATDSISHPVELINHTRAKMGIDRDVVCSGETLRFRDLCTGDEATSRWTIVPLDGNPVPPYRESGGTQDITFDHYGKYKVILNVKNVCSEDETDTTIVVKQNPDLFRYDIPAEICQPDLLRISDYVDVIWNGNQPKAEWTITRNGGEANVDVECLENTDLKTAFPMISFKKPGTYSVKVQLQNVGCTGTKLTETKTLIVHDPEIVIAVDTTPLNICENGVVQFTNRSTGEDLVYEWSIQPSAKVTFTGGTNSGSASPVIQFGKWGDYSVKLTMRTKSGCGSLDTVYRVHVRKDPSIYFFEPPEAVCPGKEYITDFHGLIEYRFYNNIEKVTWLITPQDGGFEFENSTNVNSPWPAVRFDTPGPYTFTIKLESAGCPEAGIDQQLTRTIRVRNSAMSMKAEVTDTKVCENDELQFSMKAAFGEESDPLIYSWVVLPQDNSTEFKDYGNDKKLARILFKHWGEYEVLGKTSGSCGSLDSVFKITVQKDPQVYLKDTTGICQEIADMKDYTTYAWYNNTPELAWKVTRVGLGSETGFVIDDPAAEYPKIEFTKAGEYKIQVNLVSHTLGCAADALQDVTTVLVYDTVIRGVVNMLGNGVINNVADICEGEQVAFENTTNVEGGISWEWTVEGREDGYLFDQGGKTSTVQQPTLTFSDYGDYVVHVLAIGKCTRKEYTFPVKVRGVPEVNLTGRMLKICEGDEIDMSAYLTYPDAENGNKNQDDVITYKWSVSTTAPLFRQPVIATADHKFTTIFFPEHAHYRVKLEMKSKCVVGGKREWSSEIDVIATDLEAAFKIGKDSVGCTNGSETYEIVLQNRSRGDSLEYTWMVDADPENWQWVEGNEHSESPKLLIRREGLYPVKLVAKSCRTDDTTFVFKAFSVPEVKIGSITETCEPYEFLGKNAGRIAVDIHNDAIDSVQWKFMANPGYVSEEYRFLNNTSENSVYPDIRFKSCDYTITVEYWNRCLTPGRDTFRIQVDKFIAVELALKDTAVCSQSGKWALKAKPLGGTWTFRNNIWPEPEKILSQEAGQFYFDPVFDAYFEDDVNLVYSKANGTCVARDTMNIHIHSLPRVEAGRDTGMCRNHPPMVLGGSPAGGWWEGLGVVSPVFTPSDTDRVVLSYRYVDENQCFNKDSLTMTIHTLPDTAFSTKWQWCRNEEVSFEVDATEKSYIWDYGDHTLPDTLEGSGKHQYAVFGYYDVVLIAESVHGCLDTSDIRRIEVVKDAPPAVFEMSKHAVCGPEAGITITPSESDYSDHNLRFEWNFGNGNISGDLQPENPQLYLSALYDTTYRIKFRVYNACNETSKVDSLLVGSFPKIGFRFENGERNCSPLSLQVLNTSTGTGNRYTWYMGDGKDSLLVYEPKDYLYETGVETKVFNVSLVAQNNCGKDSLMQPLTVMAQTLKAFFDKPKEEICVGDTICFTNYSRDTSRYITYKYWDYGDEVRDTSWNGCHAYKEGGRYRVRLFIDNGCTSDTTSKELQVIALPKLRFDIDTLAHCDRDTFRFAFTTDQPLQRQQWTMGDDSVILNPAFFYVYKQSGEYPVSLDVIADNRAFCKASLQTAVRVHPRPVLQWNPLDTLVCPPFLYLPQIVGQAATMMWDYGDGGGTTSSLEHLYENSSDTLLLHKIMLHSESDKGCSENYFIGKLAVGNLPVAGMRKEVRHGRPQQVDLINLSEDKKMAGCIWYLPSGRVEHTFDNRHLEFMENGIHEFSLVAFNEYGCKDSVSIEHEVLIKGLYFPNTFIPHSTNAKINRFNGIGMGLVQYKLEIFDQYNNKIWETQALENGKPSQGWDGYNFKGEKMPQGGYIWRAEAIFADDEVWTGGNNESGIPENTQGTVLLLRE